MIFINAGDLQATDVLPTLKKAKVTAAEILRAFYDSRKEFVVSIHLFKDE